MDPMRKEALILTNKGLLMVKNGGSAPQSFVHLLTTTVDGRHFLHDGFQTFIIFIPKIVNSNLQTV